MIHFITQTEFSDGAKKRGNCFSACLASLLALPIEGVPNFAASAPNEWFRDLWNWASQVGADVHSAPGRDRLERDRVYIVQGPGPRGFLHACLWAGGPDGMVIWDPHPSRTGLLECRNWIEVTKQ